MALIPYAGYDPQEGKRGRPRQTAAEKAERRTKRRSEKVDAILRRAALGEAYNKIAADYGISRQRVRQIMKQYGVAPRPGGRRQGNSER